MALRTVDAIEQELGLDNIEPIPVLSQDVAEDMREKGDPFRDWYEEELRQLHCLLKHSQL